MNIKKFLTPAVLLIALFLGGSSFVSAQVATTTATSTVVTTNSIALQTQIQQLLQQIAQLKAQILELQKKNSNSQSSVQGSQQTLEFTSKLHPGMSGVAVRRLQEVLATDPTLYLKDNITGYYGAMTKKAVKQFQKHFNLDPVGVVGPMTMEKINQILKEHRAISSDSLSENELGDLGDNDDMMEGENVHATMRPFSESSVRVGMSASTTTPTRESDKGDKGDN